MRLRGYLPVDGVGNVYCRPRWLREAAPGWLECARSYFRRRGAKHDLATFSRQLSVETDAPVQMGRSERKPSHVWAENTKVAFWWLGVRRERGRRPEGSREEGAGFGRAALAASVFSGPTNSPLTCGAPDHRRYGGGLMAVSNSTLSPSDVPLGRGWK